MNLRQIALFAIAAPLTLGLAACGGGAESGGAAPSGEKIAPIAAPAGKAWADMAAETADGGVVMGNPAAPIKVIEYGSLSCPGCAKLAQEGFAALRDKYVASGRVSLEFRSFAIHPQDVPLTVMARCGGKDTFFGLVEQIYTNFDAMSARLQAPGVEQLANAAIQGPAEKRTAGLAEALGYTDFFAARGISKDQAAACLANPAVATSVAELSAKYSADGINSTPTLLINGVKLDAADWTSLEAAIQKAGAR